MFVDLDVIRGRVCGEGGGGRPGVTCWGSPHPAVRAAHLSGGGGWTSPGRPTAARLQDRPRHGVSQPNSAPSCLEHLRPVQRNSALSNPGHLRPVLVTTTQLNSALTSTGNPSPTLHCPTQDIPVPAHANPAQLCTVLPMISESQPPSPGHPSLI